MSAAYGQRPSAILGIGDEWAAYQLDLATLRLGREVESALAEGKDIDEVLAAGAPTRPSPSNGGGGRFREPEGVRKMKIPEDGMW